LWSPWGKATAFRYYCFSLALSYLSFVILGLDPRIHAALSGVPFRWILGSSPRMTAES